MNGRIPIHPHTDSCIVFCGEWREQWRELWLHPYSLFKNGQLRIEFPNHMMVFGIFMFPSDLLFSADLKPPQQLGKFRLSEGWVAGFHAQLFTEVRLWPWIDFINRVVQRRIYYVYNCILYADAGKYFEVTIVVCVFCFRPDPERKSESRWPDLLSNPRNSTGVVSMKYSKKNKPPTQTIR